MLSVVCPVYNEADNIGPLLNELQRKVTTPMEVLLVYDREDDTTLPVARDLVPHYPFEIRLVKNRFGTGALNAIKTGFLEARQEAVLVTMADLSDDLVVVDEMYRLVISEGFDIVCGSRYMPGGKQIGGPRLKKILSRLAGVSLHTFVGLPIHDVTNSFKMYKREFLSKTPIESTGGFEVGIEMVVKAFVNGKRITEVPTTWTSRVTGKSRFRLWQWLPKYFRWYGYAFKKFGKRTWGISVPRT